MHGPVPPANNGPPRKAIRRNGETGVEIARRPSFGGANGEELRLKTGEARKGFRVKRKRRTLMFPVGGVEVSSYSTKIWTKTKLLEHEAKKLNHKNKMKNDLGDEDDEDEDE
ncbi:hypothetical protein Tco_0394192 [Tanacetum coccineum]